MPVCNVVWVEFTTSESSLCMRAKEQKEEILNKLSGMQELEMIESE